MITHGQNSPDTIRGLRDRRSLRGILDTRRKAEADLRSVDYVGPFGKGFHRVRNPGGTTAFTIADQTGGRTFAPHASVLAGSQSGKPGEALLGGAPAGRKGGVQRGANRRRRGTVAAVGNQYAFGYSAAGDLVAMIYTDATFASWRATSTGNDDCVVVGCILTDPSLLVGDGSAVLYDDTAEQHRVWDVAGEITYSYSAPAGWSLLYTHPRYYDGAIYWLEVETGITGHVDATAQFRLRTAATDLTGATTIETVTMTATDVPGQNHYHDDPYMHGCALMVDADGAVVYAYADTQDMSHNPAVDQKLQYRIALAGGASSGRDFSSDTYPIIDGSATNYPTAGKSSGGFVVFDGNAVYAKTDDASAEATLLYTPSATGLATSMNYGPDGSTLQFCHGTASSNFHIYRDNVLIASSVDYFDTTQSVTEMFYFGE